MEIPNWGPVWPVDVRGSALPHEVIDREALSSRFALPCTMPDRRPSVFMHVRNHHEPRFDPFTRSFHRAGHVGGRLHPRFSTLDHMQCRSARGLRDRGWCAVPVSSAEFA